MSPPPQRDFRVHTGPVVPGCISRAPPRRVPSAGFVPTRTFRFSFVFFVLLGPFFLSAVLSGGIRRIYRARRTRKGKPGRRNAARPLRESTKDVYQACSCFFGGPGGQQRRGETRARPTTKAPSGRLSACIRPGRAQSTDSLLMTLRRGADKNPLSRNPFARSFLRLLPSCFSLGRRTQRKRPERPTRCWR